MSIHYTDPFATPEEHRSPVRRLRGRLVSPVTLWTAPGPAGLTVSSVLVADGEPGRVLGLVDDESDLWPRLVEAGRFAVSLLRPEHRAMADRFAGLAPAPGGLFVHDRWRETDYGPVPEGVDWAGCHVVETRRCGWGMLVEATIGEIVLAEGGPGLYHHRGRYGRTDR